MASPNFQRKNIIEMPLFAPTLSPLTVRRWLGAADAVSWLLRKLDAAESVWAAAAKAAGAAGLPFVPADYCLVPDGDADVEFFCSDWSNEMLEAAGVRNDDDDYFKVCVLIVELVVWGWGSCVFGEGGVGNADDDHFKGGRVCVCGGVVIACALLGRGLRRGSALDAAPQHYGVMRWSQPCDLDPLVSTL
jgi:hypothetical protein